MFAGLNLIYFYYRFIRLKRAVLLFSMKYWSVAMEMFKAFKQKLNILIYVFTTQLGSVLSIKKCSFAFYNEILVGYYGNVYGF